MFSGKMTYLAETWQVISRPREGRRRLCIIIILTCMAIHQACLWGEGDITMLYVRHRPLRWSASQYGYYLTGGFLASGKHQVSWPFMILEIFEICFLSFDR